MKANKKRQIILIDHRFQLRMAALFIVLQVFLTGLFAFGLYVFMDSEIHTDLATAHVSYQSLSQMMLPIVSVLSLFNIVLSGILVTVFVVLISHKIAGPLYRFRTVLESLAQRHFDPFMKIRPDDQLGELAISIDNAVGTIKADMTLLQQSAKRLQQAHETADASAVATEIALIEKTLAGWHG